MSVGGELLLVPPMLLDRGSNKGKEQNIARSAGSLEGYHRAQ